MYVARSVPFRRYLLAPLTSNLVRSKGEARAYTYLIPRSQQNSFKSLSISPLTYALQFITKVTFMFISFVFFRSQAYMVRSGDNIFLLTKNSIQMAEPKLNLRIGTYTT